ncbi:MAG: phosphoserine phosphatase SerB [Bdellovibrionota bacterium]
MASPKKTTVLVTISGQDTPGITSEMTGILSKSEVTISDIGQSVIHGLLSLSILFELGAGDEKELLKDLLFKATEMGLKLEYRVIDSHASRGAKGAPKPCHYAVTLIAQCVSAHALHEVTRTLARFRVNIDVIKRLSENEFSCVELLVSSPVEIDQSVLKKELLAIAKEASVDIALQTEGLYRRAKRLVVFDMDSTLIQSEVIDELARAHGVYAEVSEITHQAMMGKMDYDESLRQRVAKLAGLTTAELEKVFSRLQLTPGAEDLIHVVKKLGYKIALISGGFTFVADRLKEKLGIDFAYANVLEVREGKVTGRVNPPIVNAQRKADLLEVIAQQERIELDQVIAVGDGANDLLMLERAGLGIAFNAKPLVREQADLALSQKNLRSILYLLGLNGREVAEAMA